MVEIEAPTRMWDRPVAAAEVAENLGAARFSVAGTEWSALCPQLSDELATLLAPPVVVRAAAFPSVPRRGAGRHRRRS